jgi:signal transduction histidine kinase
MQENLAARMIVAAALVLALLAANAEAAAPKKILIVHSFGRDFAPYNPTGQAFRTRLTELLKQAVVFHEVSLDVERGELEDERPLVEYLLRRTHDARPDLVVAIANPAAHFCLRHRAQLFPDRALLVTGIDQRRLSHLQLHDGDGVVTADLDFPGVARTILTIQPDTTTVALVLGATKLEQYWADQIQRDLAPFANRLRLVPLTNLDLDGVRQRVAGLPPHSAVFYYMFAVGADGLHYESEQALAAIRDVTRAPIFGSFASQLGNGIVGGGLIDMAQFGHESAPMAVRMLAGESGGHTHVATQQPTFDWRQLQRWNLREANLPPGSVVRFRLPTLWSQYKWQLTGIGLLLFAQATLIAVLARSRRRGRRLTRELQMSEKRLALAAAAGDLGMWLWNMQTNALWATERTKEIFGFSPGCEPTYDMFYGRVHPEDRLAVDNRIATAVSGKTNFELQYRICLPDGVEKWLAACGEVTFEKGDVPASMAGIVSDITERRRTALELVHNRQELTHFGRVSTMGQLASSLAHELNQPLSAILRNAEAAEIFLRSDSPDLKELREILADIRKDDRRAGEVIDRMRGLLKRREFQAAQLDANELASEVVALARPDAEARKVALVLQPSPRPATAWGDRVQLQQVLLNLLLNGMDAINNSPLHRRTVSLQVRPHPSGVELAICDTGQGITQENLKRLFDSFFTTKPNGLGMGLAISQSIIVAHGGRITAQNNESGGATFRFALPADAPRGREA